MARGRSDMLPDLILGVGIAALAYYGYKTFFGNAAAAGLSREDFLIPNAVFPSLPGSRGGAAPTPPFIIPGTSIPGTIPGTDTSIFQNITLRNIFGLPDVQPRLVGSSGAGARPSGGGGW